MTVYIVVNAEGTEIDEFRSPEEAYRFIQLYGGSKIRVRRLVRCTCLYDCGTIDGWH